MSIRNLVHMYRISNKKLLFTNFLRFFFPFHFYHFISRSSSKYQNFEIFSKIQNLPKTGGYNSDIGNDTSSLFIGKTCVKKYLVTRWKKIFVLLSFSWRWNLHYFSSLFFMTRAVILNLILSNGISSNDYFPFSVITIAIKM